MPQFWFDHVHLRSTDTVKTAEFYEKMFGAKIVNKMEFGEGKAMVSLDLNGTSILIAPAEEGTVQNGLDHFGIRTDDLKTAIDELKSQGVPFTQDYREVSPTFKMSFLTAPENVKIELQEGTL
ncbi:MAG: VOC family protein [Dehalococcoidales bacterium]|nr:VOC family protein [Dehalococcoidales bacterium]